MTTVPEGNLAGIIVATADPGSKFSGWKKAPFHLFGGRQVPLLWLRPGHATERQRAADALYASGTTLQIQPIFNAKTPDQLALQGADACFGTQQFAAGVVLRRSYRIHNVQGEFILLSSARTEKVDIVDGERGVVEFHRVEDFILRDTSGNNLSAGVSRSGYRVDFDARRWTQLPVREVFTDAFGITRERRLEYVPPRELRFDMDLANKEFHQEGIVRQYSGPELAHGAQIRWNIGEYQRAVTYLGQSGTAGELRCNWREKEVSIRAREGASEVDTSWSLLGNGSTAGGVTASTARDAPTEPRTTEERELESLELGFPQQDMRFEL